MIIKTHGYFYGLILKTNTIITQNRENMTLKLWELKKELMDLDNQIDSLMAEEGLSEDEKENALNKLLEKFLASEQSFNKKATDIASYIQYLEVLNVGRKAKIKELQQSVKSSESVANGLRKYLTIQMQLLNKSKIEGEEVVIRTRQNPLRLVLTCEDEDLPKEFQRIEITPDKRAIRKYLETNQDCEFAELVDGGKTIIIK